jgi:hypothetical protein
MEWRHEPPLRSAGNRARSGQLNLCRNGLSAVIPVGTVTHLLFTALQTNMFDGASMERAAQVRLIVPTDQLRTIALTALSGRVDLPTGAERETEAPELH